MVPGSWKLRRRLKPGAKVGLPSRLSPWQDRLTEEQIWQVIIYLYEATGQQPRRWEPASMAGIRIVAALLLLAGAAPPSRRCQRGKAVYERKCLLCHGEKGTARRVRRAAGAEAARLHEGLYKIRSTANKTPAIRTSSESSPRDARDLHALVGGSSR